MITNPSLVLNGVMTFTACVLQAHDGAVDSEGARGARPWGEDT